MKLHIEVKPVVKHACLVKRVHMKLLQLIVKKIETC